MGRCQSSRRLPPLSAIAPISAAPPSLAHSIFLKMHRSVPEIKMGQKTGCLHPYVLQTKTQRSMAKHSEAQRSIAKHSEALSYGAEARCLDPVPRLLPLQPLRLRRGTLRSRRSCAQANARDDGTHIFPAASRHNFMPAYSVQWHA